MLIIAIASSNSSKIEKLDNGLKNDSELNNEEKK